jgi:ABC-type polysaccharide/polyol phosphate transport system ATPase subunit
MEAPGPAVVVDGLHKSFRLPHERVHTLKERVLHPFHRATHENFHALRPLSFAVAEGEFFGIVGRNGSGKSTLLKCLAGIYRADGGQAWIRGRLSTFIELGVGFNMDLAARDNIVINGVMLGLAPREARRRADEVIDFAGLQQFTELKVKNYSSGMLVRLGFSVLIHVDADVLLIDEVLAVGDAEFQQKCHDQFNAIRRAGKTVLLVTHDMGAVERYCDRAMLLEQGEMTLLGGPHEVGMHYLQVNFEQPRAEPAPDHADEANRYGDRRAEILRTWFEDAEGQPATTLPHGRACALCAEARFREDVDDPLFGFNLHSSADHNVLAANSGVTGGGAGGGSGRFRAGEHVTFRVRFENLLASGRYEVTPAVAQGAAWLDRRERLASVVVTSTHATDAVVDLPYEVRVERSTSSSEALV